METWPDRLKNTVRILLTSRFPMWMAWGPELTFLYNDSYARTTLGKKHPWALGKPASEVWREIWKDIGPRIQRVMETGEASWDETLHADPRAQRISRKRPTTPSPIALLKDPTARSPECCAS